MNQYEINKSPTFAEELGLENESTNQATFSDILRSCGLSEEWIHQNLGDIDQVKKKETVEEILKEEDKEKLKTYKRLKVQDLPDDWKIQLERLKTLESNQFDYNQKTKELDDWKNTFQGQTHEEVNQKLKELEQRPDIPQTTWDDFKDRKSVTEYDEVKENLDAWTDTFRNQTPIEAEKNRVVLLEKHKILDDELQEWHRDFPQLTSRKAKQKLEEVEQDLETTEHNLKTQQDENQELNDKLEKLEKGLKIWTNTFGEKGAKEIELEIEDLKEKKVKLEEWIQTWKGREPQELKKEWLLLKRRPDIPIKEKQWWDDYTHRKSVTKSEQEYQELIESKRKTNEFEKENEELWQIIRGFLENWIEKRYTLIDPVLTFEDAQKKIAELLEVTEREWENYLNSTDPDIAKKKIILGLSFWNEEKKSQARETLKWIKEARQTKDYQTLFKKWCRGDGYQVKYDFDGSLYILKNRLKVMS